MQHACPRAERLPSPKLLPARVWQKRDLQLPATQAGAAAATTQGSPQKRPQQPTQLDPLLIRGTPQPPQPGGRPNGRKPLLQRRVPELTAMPVQTRATP